MTLIFQDRWRVEVVFPRTGPPLTLQHEGVTMLEGKPCGSHIKHLLSGLASETWDIMPHDSSNSSSLNCSSD